MQYQVVQESIYDAFYRLTNARAQITAYVFDVVRAIVPKSNLDDVFLTKEEVSVYNQQATCDFQKHAKENSLCKKEPSTCERPFVIF